MRDGLILPLIVKNQKDQILFALLINEKGYRKTIENSELWFIDSQTERLLPYDGEGKYISIDSHGTWYSCVMDMEASLEKEDESIIKTQSIDAPDILSHLSRVISQRKIEMPKGSYTTHLFEKGLEKIKKKTGEEAIELILATEKEEVIYEAADLIYHLMVLLEEQNINIEQVLGELKRREG